MAICELWTVVEHVVLSGLVHDKHAADDNAADGLEQNVDEEGAPVLGKTGSEVAESIIGSDTRVPSHDSRDGK